MYNFQPRLQTNGEGGMPPDPKEFHGFLSFLIGRIHIVKTDHHCCRNTPVSKRKTSWKVLLVVSQLLCQALPKQISTRFCQSSQPLNTWTDPLHKVLGSRLLLSWNLDPTGRLPKHQNSHSQLFVTWTGLQNRRLYWSSKLCMPWTNPLND